MLPEKIDGTHFLSPDDRLDFGCHKIPLGANLDQALRSLRLRDQDRTIWIDAICINQADITERGHQVAQMGKIYESATAVTAWLGEASENSDHALQFFRGLWHMNTN